MAQGNLPKSCDGPPDGLEVERRPLVGSELPKDADRRRDPEFAKGVVLLPKQWRVEQSLGVLTISRRLELDYEILTHVSAAAMLLASITTSGNFPDFRPIHKFEMG